MPVTYINNSEDLMNSKLLQAFNALREQEASLMTEISIAQTRLEKVRLAISSMRPLVTLDASVKSNQDDLKFEEVPASGLSSLPFSKALESFMRSVNTPLSVREITNKFSEAGYKYSSTSPINQVNVSLRRGLGKAYDRIDGKWAHKLG